MNQNQKKFKCCLCGKDTEGFGNNPYPLGYLEKNEICCDTCNAIKVIPARIQQLLTSKSPTLTKP